MLKLLDQKEEENVLRWYGHVERRDGTRAVKMVYESDYDEQRREGGMVW